MESINNPLQPSLVSKQYLDLKVDPLEMNMCYVRYWRQGFHFYRVLEKCSLVSIRGANLRSSRGELVVPKYKAAKKDSPASSTESWLKGLIGKVKRANQEGS